MLSCRVARAVERDDIYAEVSIGPRIIAHTYVAQMSAVVGYAFMDSIGVGILADQSFDSVTQVALDGRWFLEPFEVFAGGGARWRVDPVTGQTSTVPLFHLGATYLLALTSSLAFKIEGKGQFLLEDVGNLYIGAGFRFVF